MSVINEGKSRKETSVRESLSADARASETGRESAFGDGSPKDVLPSGERRNSLSSAEEKDTRGGSVATLEKPRSVFRAREKKNASLFCDETEKKKRRRADPGVAETATRLGFDGLYAGWQERLAHVAAVVVIQLVVYDDIKHALIR